MMNITKNTHLTNVDKIIRLKKGLAYVRKNQLTISNSVNIILPNSPHVVTDILDDYNVYVSGQENSYIYKVNEGKQLNLIHDKKADGFIIISPNEFILVDEEGKKNTLSYYQNGVLKWNKPKEKKDYRTAIKQ